MKTNLSHFFIPEQDEEIPLSFAEHAVYFVRVRPFVLPENVIFCFLLPIYSEAGPRHKRILLLYRGKYNQKGEE
jgi:hypothetical protein